MSEFALGIQTINPNKYPSEPDHFVESDYFEIFSIALTTKVTDSFNTKVFFRESLSPHDEWRMIEESIDWLTEIVDGEYESNIIYTYNGEAFDFIHLRGRAEILEDKLNKSGLVNKVRDVIERFNHIDLHNMAWKKYGDYNTLRDVCSKLNITLLNIYIDDYSHGLKPEEWRDPSNSCTEKVLREDISVLGEYYISYKNNKKLKDEKAQKEIKSLLYDYASSEVQSVFKLSNKLIKQ